MNDKKKIILISVIAAIAVVTVVATIAMYPFGKSKPIIQQTESSAEAVITTLEQTTEKETVSQAETTEGFSVSVPAPTEGTTNPYKNYTLFVDKRTFEYTEEKGVTDIVAIENRDVTVTVTPYKGTSYSDLCKKVNKDHKSLGSDAMLELKNIHSVYGSQTGDGDSDIITTVYCINDGNGGSVEIVCKRPVGATDYQAHIDLLLSMFKTQ